MTATISGDGTSTLINLTTSGNTVLGDASTDTLNVGNGGLVKDASGNVGIGTSSPTTKLTVSYTGKQITLKAFEGTQNNTASIECARANFVDAASNLLFYTNSASSESERMRIDSSGNLLVGTTSNGRTDSNGTAIDPTGIVYQNHITGTASGSFYTRFSLAGTQIGSISQNGTTAVLYNTTSDYRLKTDVAPINNALSTIGALNPISFTWVDGRKDDGFLAHELQAVIPNCVNGEKDAVDEDGKPVYQQMDNSGVIPFLVKAIQEQQAIITALQADVEALKAR